jgi:hypothetical protein
MPSIPKTLSVRSGIWLLPLFACSAQGQKPQAPPPTPAQLPLTRPLATAPLAGQIIAVLPLTLVVADPALEADPAYTGYSDRRAALLRADSLVGEGLRSRGPEVNWILPPQLRKIARRSAGVVDDPDQMGQAILRSPGIEKVPDPLRSSIRALVALAGGRLALVPASLGFGPDPNGQIRADLTLVLADSRSGKVLWRSLAYGRGATPDQALNAAMAAVLPLAGGP